MCWLALDSCSCSNVIKLSELSPKIFDLSVSSYYCYQFLFTVLKHSWTCLVCIALWQCCIGNLGHQVELVLHTWDCICLVEWTTCFVIEKQHFGLVIGQNFWNCPCHSASLLQQHSAQLLAAPLLCHSAQKGKQIGYPITWLSERAFCWRQGKYTRSQSCDSF